MLIVAYASFFSVYTLQRHATLNTTASGLSSIDQAMWNTVHGRFLERTVGTQQVSRTTGHLELILLPLSLVYVLWDDVAAMLIIQSLALAAGALPVFWIARRAYAPRMDAPTTFSGVRGAPGAGDRRRAEWLALAFALAYLLMPAIQAANVAGFHTATWVVAPLLFAFWYGTEGRWRPMWGWALVVMAAREDYALLTAMLGLLLILSERRPERTKQGLALLLVSIGWCAAVSFLIVAPAARQAAGGAAQNAWSWGRLADLAALREPAWLDALGGLLRSVGWLALLAPEILLLGLPFLVTHALTTPTGPAGELWELAAPLAPVFIIASIYGARRLQRFIERQAPFRLTPLATNATVISVLGAIWLLAWAGSAQIERGWTPLARPYQWPALTDHHRTLARLTGQIPPSATVSATPAVHPHLSHRHKIYVYPDVSDATHLLIDVAGFTGMPPGDVKSSVDRLIEDGGYGVVDAADGYLLLARGAAARALPDDFYSFTRAGEQRPEIPVGAQIGPGLRLLGFDVLDDVRSRLTRFRFYWQVAGATLPPNLAIRYEARTPAGAVVDSSEQRPLPALLWRDPGQWGAGEVVVTETAPWFLPRAFAPALQVTDGGQVIRPELSGPDAAASATPAEVAGDGTLRLPGFARREGRLRLYEGPLTSIETSGAAFAGADWTVRLAEWSAPMSAAPGGELPILLYWQAAGAAPQAYSVFLHLADVTGKIVAAVEGEPTWFTPRPATTWQVGSDGAAGVIDAHTIAVPGDVQPGRYELVVGWIDGRNGERLSHVSGLGNSAGEEAVLGPVTIDPMAGPRPDACCLAAEACCTSME